MLRDTQSKKVVAVETEGLESEINNAIEKKAKRIVRDILEKVKKYCHIHKVLPCQSVQSP